MSDKNAAGQDVPSIDWLEASFKAWKEYTCAPDDFETYERWIKTKPDVVFGNWGVNMSQAQYFHAGFIAASNVTGELPSNGGE